MTKAVMNRLSAAAFLALLGASGSVLAAPTCPETLDPQANYKCVFINNGAGANTFGNGITGGFYELGLTGTLATSIYQAGLGLGSTVIDSNRTSVINSYGFAGNTNYSAIAGGGQVNINDTASTQQKNVDALNATGDTEGLNVDFGAGLQGWQLTFDYIFNGTLTAGGPQFNSGDIIFSYKNLATNASETVLRVNVTGSTLQLANLTLSGLISFDFDNNGSNDCVSALCQGFWNFQTGPQNWYDISGQGVQIAMNLDSNVNPPFPTLDQLAAGSNAGYWARQTTLDSSIRFIDVPEPGSLALVGLALVGLAGASTRRLRKV